MKILKRIQIAGAIVCLAITPALIHTQDVTASEAAVTAKANQLQSLDFHVGHWSMDISGFGQEAVAGMKQAGIDGFELLVEWGPDKKYMIWRDFKIVNGKPVELAHKTFGWNYVSEQIEFWGVTTDGNIFDGIGTVEEAGKMIRDFTIDFPQGNSLHMRELITCDQSCRWVTEYEKDGEWLKHPYYPPFTYLPAQGVQ